MSGLFPEGLSRTEFETLNRCVHEVSDVALSDLVKEAEAHVQKARMVAEENCMVNVVLAEGLFSVIRQLAEHWETIPPHAEPWCKGMIRYFTTCDDDEDDFSSPIGFDDDAEVFNACLRLAGREDLCINPEDFDDAC